MARATLRDIALANTLFGGRSAVAFGLDHLLDGRGHTAIVTVLDLGAGEGDVLRWMADRFNSQRQPRIRPLAFDWHPVAARLCRDRGLPIAVGDVEQLPFAPASVDIVVASQLLHHFPRETAVALLAKFDRLARIGVVIADLERRALAALGIWAASFALAFHRASRRDGVTSVRRGFTEQELADLLDAAGIEGTVHRRPGYRLVALWETCRADT